MLIIALEKKKSKEEEEEEAFGGFQYWGCSGKDFLKNLQSLCVAFKNETLSRNDSVTLKNQKSELAE